MTDDIYFDCDCISAFLSVGKEYLLVRFFEGNIVIPRQVYNELNKVLSFKNKLNSLLAREKIRLEEISVNTQEANLYIKLTTSPDPGFCTIGRGEAAAITLAKFNNGILASNNFRDIKPYIDLYKLRYTTTGNILKELLSNEKITIKEGNLIWEAMKRNQRFLPTNTFSEYLKLNII